LNKIATIIKLLRTSILMLIKVEIQILEIQVQKWELVLDVIQDHHIVMVAEGIIVIALYYHPYRPFNQFILPSMGLFLLL
jgi:hypothetical protein